MSIWTDKQGRRHVGIMVAGQRIYRILPEGASAGDAKHLDAQLRAAVANNKSPVIPDDPALPQVMGLYLEHFKTLRSPESTKFHALRIGQ
jgi:hypothetical protein